LNGEEGIARRAHVWSAWKRTYLANCFPKNTNQLCDILFANEHAMCDQNLLKGCILASKLFSENEWMLVADYELGQ